VAQPENNANPKTTNTDNKITFFISLLLFLDVQSDDCNVNKSNSHKGKGPDQRKVFLTP